MAENMAKKGRILVFSTSYFPMIGGAEVAIREITDRLTDWDFEMITSREAGGLREEKIGNVLVHRVGPRGKMGKLLLPLFGTIKVFSLLRKQKYNLFWPVMATFASGVPYIANILRSKKKQIPVVLTLQEGDSVEHIEKRWGGLIALSWKLALPRTDHLTVISNYLKSLAIQYGYDGEITLIPNGVDLDKFQKVVDKQELVELKRELKKEKEDVFLVTTSRLAKKNGVEDVIKALTFLPRNIKFIVVGDGELKSELKKLSKDINVSDRVMFVGKVGQNEILKYLKVSDIFIRPSLSEGQGISFIEAMATGIPVLATKVGGIPDFLKDRETGLFVGVKNPEDISAKVKILVEDHKLKSNIVENAKEMVKERYDWDKIVPDMEQVILSQL